MNYTTNVKSQESEILSMYPEYSLKWNKTSEVSQP